MRPFSITKGWLAATVRVSNRYGDKTIWPGDTFGLSILPGRHLPLDRQRVILSWGSAINRNPNSDIYAASAPLPHPTS